MSKKVNYSITYQGLSTGNHDFEFVICGDLFKQFDQSEVFRGKGIAKINLDKGNTYIRLDVSVKSEVEVECDRCLDHVAVPVDFFGTLVVKFSDSITEPEYDQSLNTDEDILWLNPAEQEIDLTQYIYESICLSLPFQRVHPADENGNFMCDPDMLNRFSIIDSSTDEALTDEDDSDQE